VILLAADDRLRLVTQPDHAAFAADVLALLRLPGLVGHPRRTALLRAVRLHDNGWQELDSAPLVDPASGRPYTFVDLPEPQRVEVWRRGAARYRESDAYTALLTGEHALALLGGRAGDERWDPLLADLVEQRETLLDRCNLEPPALLADYRFLDLADRLSLLVCTGAREPLERLGIRAWMRDGELVLDPFPLAGATTFALSCRHVPDRRYDGDADLGVTLAVARWETLPVRLVPAGAGG
jgi:hypothetical protein